MSEGSAASSPASVTRSTSSPRGSAWSSASPSGPGARTPSRAAQASSSVEDRAYAPTPRLRDVVGDHRRIRVEGEQRLPEVERRLRRAAEPTHQAVHRKGGRLPVVEALVGHEDTIPDPHPLLEPQSLPGGQLPDVGGPRVDRLAVRYREDPCQAGGPNRRPLQALRDRRASTVCVPTAAPIRCLAHVAALPSTKCRAGERGSREPARRMAQGIAPAAGGPHRSASGPPRQMNQSGPPDAVSPPSPEGPPTGGPGGPGWGGINGGDPRPTEGRAWGGSRLCSPARAGGVDGGERGDTLRQPAGGLTAERATTVMPARSAGDNFRGTATSAAPGPSRAPFPLHGEGPGHAPAGGNFRGTATSACARGRGVLPRMHAAGPAWARHALSWLGTRAGPRHAPRMHAEGPGECARVGTLPGNSYLGPRRGRAVRCVLCTAKAPGVHSPE